MLDDLVLNVGGDASSIPTIMGFFNFANSFSALFAGTLNKMISMRSTAIIGAVLLVTGNILSVFATSVNHLIVSYGIIFGRLITAHDTQTHTHHLITKIKNE